MASRLRGMVCLSATIVPRVQRLLETAVLKEKPVWLDVVEAYPPLPPPALPPSQLTGRAVPIIYPYEQTRNKSSMSVAATSGLSSASPFSLFETRSIKRVRQWPRHSQHTPQDIRTLAAEQAEATPAAEEQPVTERSSQQLTTGEPSGDLPVRTSVPLEEEEQPGLEKVTEEVSGLEEVAEEVSGLEEVAEEVSVRATESVQEDPLEQPDPPAAAHPEQPTHSHLDNKLKELQAILKTYE